MGLALKKRMDMGFTFLKMDLGIGLLLDEPGTINAPLGFIDDMKKYASHVLNAQGGSVTADMVRHQKSYQIVTTAHPFTGIQITEKGLDYLENYVKEVRDVIGYDVPLAIDHFGHVQLESCISGRAQNSSSHSGRSALYSTGLVSVSVMPFPVLP